MTIPGSPSVAPGYLDPNPIEADELLERMAELVAKLYVCGADLSPAAEYETAIPGYFSSEKPAVSDADDGDAAK